MNTNPSPEPSHPTPSTANPSFSIQRIVTVILPIVGIAALVFWLSKKADEQAREEIRNWPAKQFGLDKPTSNRLAAKFQDADGDLIADRPAPDQCINPETIYFSYIPGDDTSEQVSVWGELMDAIAQATGKPVEYRSSNTVAEQLEALANGDLHITGINTGSVAKAVNVSGFVPRFVFGNEEGPFGYTMKFIVPARSELNEIKDLAGQTIVFTSADSNSGFKAPVVMLKYDYDLTLGRDYEFRFSTSHDDSIRMVAAGEASVASIASDMLERAVAAEDVDPTAVREIYSSEKFPSATIGLAHDLEQGIAKKIVAAIKEFSLEDSELAKSLGLSESAKFVEIQSYKDEWALVRRTDDALGVIHETKKSPAK